MSWLSNFLGTSPIRHDFNYDVNTADYKTDPRLLASMGDLNRTGGRLLGMGNQMYGSGMDLISGKHPLLMQQRQWLTRGLQDLGATQGLALNRNLAMRGIGAGGRRSIVGASRDRGLGEQYQKGLLGIGQLGLESGTRLAGLGSQAVGQAGGLYGQAGQLGAGIDARSLQAGQWNAGQMNQRNQFASQMGYQQAVDNRNQRASFGNSLLSLAGGIGGQFLGAHLGRGIMSHMAGLGQGSDLMSRYLLPMAGPNYGGGL